MTTNLYTPIAIVLGSGLIAAALFFGDGGQQIIAQAERLIGNMDRSENYGGVAGGVTRDRQRNLYGDPNAETTIVEFSDYECPFCAQLHPTLKNIVDSSGGEVNWEYRHLPLPMHAGAFQASVISECVARELGTDAFWNYTESIFNGEAASVEGYRTLARNLGLSNQVVEDCEADPVLNQVVQADADTAAFLGGNGTPFSVIVFPDGTTKSISGALPHEHWVNVLGL